MRYNSPSIVLLTRDFQLVGQGVGMNICKVQIDSHQSPLPCRWASVRVDARRSSIGCRPPLPPESCVLLPLTTTKAKKTTDWIQRHLGEAPGMHRSLSKLPRQPKGPSRPVFSSLVSSSLSLMSIRSVVAINPKCVFPISHLRSPRSGTFNLIQSSLWFSSFVRFSFRS